MAGDTTLGTAQIPIRATLDQLDKDLAGVRGKIEGALSGVQDLGKVALGGLAAGAGIAAGALAGIAAAATAGLNSTLRWGDQLDKLGDLFGMSGEQASTYTFLMNRMGLSVDEGAQGLNYFTRQLDASNALSKKGIPVQNAFSDAMAKLGIKTKDSGGKLLSFNDLMPGIMDKFKALPAGVDASALAMDMFGARGGSKFLDFLRQGSTGLDDAKAKAAEFGLMMSTGTSDAVEQFGFQQNELNLRLEGFKNKIGMVVLPMLGNLMQSIGPIADKALPLLDNALKAIGPIAEDIGNSVGIFVDRLMETGSPIGALSDALVNFPDIKATFDGIVAGVQSFLASIQPTIDQVTAWLSQNVQLNDVLIALGIAIASVVIPAILGVVATVAPIIAAFVLLVAAVSLLRQAWESDWGGIRTNLTAFWEGTAKPALEQLWAWLQVNVPAAIQTLANFWTGTLAPAILSVWTWIQTVLLPMLSNLWIWLSTNIPVAIQTLADFWNNTLMPAIQAVWEFIQTNLLPLFIALVDLGLHVVQLAVTALSVVWNTVFLPALKAIWEFIDTKLMPVFRAVADVVQNVLGRAFLWVKDNVFAPFSAAIDGIVRGVQFLIGIIDDAIAAMNKLSGKVNSSPVMGHSPSPLEISLRGIRDELGALAGMAMPTLTASLERASSAELAPRGGEQGASRSGPSIVNIYGLSLNGVQDRAGLLEQLQGYA